MNEKNWTDMADQLEFSLPKRTCRQPNPSIIPTTPTTNQYGILSKDSTINDIDMEVPHATVPPITTETRKMRKCPPVIITDSVKSPDKFHKKMKEIMKGKFFIKYYQDEIKINALESNDYKNLVATLKAEKIEFFTYTPKEDSKKKIVVKAACFTTEEEIKTRLAADHKLKLEEIQCLKMKGKGMNTHSFLVSVPKKLNLKDIKKTTELDHIKLEWQKYHKKSKVSQCFRCQHFGHGSSQCFQTPRCVKCGNNHHTSECDIKERNSDRLKCANCKGGHTANYKQCPSYLRYVESLTTAQKNPNPNSVNPTPKPQIKYSIRTPSKSYADAFKNSSNSASHQNNENLTDFQSLLNEINELNKICNIGQLLKLVRDLKEVLKDCKSPLDKIIVIQNLAEKYGL